MPIAVDRERRSNAGSRMAKLLNEEEEDEFYLNTYGGFTEEDEDIDYESESSVEDIIDSDFADEADSSTSEHDDVPDEEDEEGRKRRHSNRVITKGYKEPKRAKLTQKQQQQDSKSEKKTTTPTTESQSKTSLVKDQSVSSVKSSDSSSTYERSKLRASTLQSSADTESGTNRKRLASLENSSAIRRKALLAEIAQRKNVPEVRRLTQEELLAEAKITEEINRRSLARYQRLEIEKKKARIQKSVHSTPMIRYHSFTVPIIEEQPNIYGVYVDSEMDSIRAGPIITDDSARCSRNLITFASEACLRACMPKTATNLPEPGDPAPLLPSAAASYSRLQRPMRICPISGLPARYLDPLTLTPYANLSAFRVLRRLYAIHLETNTPPIDLLREYRNNR